MFSLQSTRRIVPVAALALVITLTAARADQPEAGALPAIPDAVTTYVPVARRPRSEVLVRGQEYVRPDLTRAVVNDYRDLLAWILNIRFSEAQCDEIEQRMIARWPSLLKMDTDEITGASKLNAEIRAMPPAQLKVFYKTTQEQVLKNLRDMVGGASMLGSFKVVTEDDRRQAAWLLAIYEDQHPQVLAPMPAVDAAPAGAPTPARQSEGSGPPAKQGDAPGGEGRADAVHNAINQQQQLLQMQQLQQMYQMQNQHITMMSNVARSAHETNMRIIDNMRPTRHPWD